MSRNLNLAATATFRARPATLRERTTFARVPSLWTRVQRSWLYQFYIFQSTYGAAVGFAYPWVRWFAG